jgi:hypothetical protein
VLAYKYLETLPHLAKSGNTFWVIPGELTEAVRAVTEAFGDHSRMGAPTAEEAGDDGQRSQIEERPGSRELAAGDRLPLNAAATANRVAELAQAAVSDAKAEAVAAEGSSDGTPPEDARG